MTLFSSLAYAQENPHTWTAPCFEGPCEYTYEDADRSIVIRKITGAQSAGLLIDVQLQEVAGFRAGAAAGDFEDLSSMAQREGAAPAINADDYSTHKYGIIIRDGQCLRKYGTTRHMLAVLPDGSFETVSDRTSQPLKELPQLLQAENVMHTFEFGPVLVENGEIVAFSSSFDVISTRESRREPRTAIA